MSAAMEDLTANREASSSEIASRGGEKTRIIAVSGRESGCGTLRNVACKAFFWILDLAASRSINLIKQTIANGCG